MSTCLAVYFFQQCGMLTSVDSEKLVKPPTQNDTQSVALLS